MKPTARKWTLLAISCVALSLIVGVVAVGNYFYHYGLKGPPQKLVWDLSIPPDTVGHWQRLPGHSISHVGWPKTNHDTAWGLQGYFDLTIHGGQMGPGLPHREFHEENVQTIWVCRDGDAISAYHIHFDMGMTAEHAYHKVQDVMNKWSGGIRTPRGATSLDDWYRDVAAGKYFYGDQFYVWGLNGGEALITLFGKPQEGSRRRSSLALSMP